MSNRTVRGPSPGTSPQPRRRRVHRIVIAASMAPWLGGALRAQPATGVHPPQIRSVELEGVESVPERQLKFALSTKSSYCRLALVSPVCWFVNSPFFVRRHYLEPGELEGDIVTLRRVYWQRGFREARIDTVVSERRRGLGITFVVHEGPPTIVDTVIVDQQGDVVSPDVIRGALHVRRGGPLNLAALDTGLVQLRNALWDAGYADAAIEPEVRVDDRARRATVRIRVDPRWRTRVGSIAIEGNRNLSDAALRRALTLQPGGLFRRRDVLESQKYLYQSLGVASAVIISPPEGDSLERVEVRVQENPPRRIGVMAGFNTVEFAQLGGRAGFFALGGGLWQLDIRGATGNLFARQLEGVGPFTDVAGEDGGDAASPFARPTWQGSVEVTRLWAGSPRNRVTAGAFGHRRSEPSAFVDRGVGGFVAFSREEVSRAPLTVGYRFERSAVDAGDVYFCQSYGLCDAETVAALRDRHRLASVTANAWVDRSNDGVAPSRGFTLRLDADHASAMTGSEFGHTRLAAEGTVYRPLGSLVVAARARAGWVGGAGGSGPLAASTGAASAVLHPRTLFYAGGVESVRGYAENQLGPRVLRVRSDDLLAHGCTEGTLADATCDPNAATASAFSPRPIGATRLLEGSVELRVPVTGSIGAVLFADAAVLGGSAAGAIDSRVTGFTPGAGLRYQANVGTLRLDLGWRPRRQERLPVVVETRAADGTARVTRLATERRWDTLEEADEGRGVFRRFTVHFVLGHSF